MAIFPYTVPGASAADVIPLDMYNFLIAPIRDADQKSGQQFLQRYFQGLQTSWQKTAAIAMALKLINSAKDCPDELLVYLKDIVGWTVELKHITDGLSSEQLRRLINASGAFWNERGTEKSLIDLLGELVTARCRIWNWFDFRWVLDETQMGEEHEGRDPWVIDLPSAGAHQEYYSNLRIVDNGTLSHLLVQECVKLVRSAGERWEISYLGFLDLFITDGDDVQWTKPLGISLLVANGRLSLSDGTQTESTTSLVVGSSAWTQYVFFARIRGTSTAGGGYWGITFYYTDESNHYSVLIDTTAAQMVVRKVVAGVVTDLATVPLNATTLFVYPGIWYGCRVEIVREGATNRILVYLDATLLANVTDATFNAGTLGLRHLANATMDCDETEMMLLPATLEVVDINS